MRIPDQFIDDLVATTDIVGVIDQRVPLKRQGHEYRACCPFHDEKTPSFYVSPQKQFYHCFGCGAHGTAISFLMNYDNRDFREAVEELAALASMSIPEEAQTPGKPRENQQNLVELMEKAKAWFQQQLKSHPDAPAVIQYLKQRGMSGQIAVKFGVGFAPESWDGLIKALGTDANSLKALVLAGLVIDKDGRTYDRFRNRVMFPIQDYKGRYVAFGGRIIGEGEPKYLNSPETPLFHKGSELYNLSNARREIGQLGYSLVVEGYMDVIGLAQHGINNAVATLGTATTSTHLQRLFRAAKEIVFCFDGDRAGRKAAWRAMETALAELKDGYQVSILLLPDGHDPDSLVREEGVEAFQKRIKNALPLPDFLFNTLSENNDLDRLDGRARLADQARPLLTKLPSGTFRELMFDRLSKLMGIDQTDTGEVAPNRPRPATRSPNQPEPFELTKSIELAIQLLLQTPSLATEVPLSELLLTDTSTGIRLLKYLYQLIEDKPALSTAQLLERVRGKKFHSYLEKLAIEDHLVAEDTIEPVFRDCLVQLEKRERDRLIQSLLAKTQNGKLEADEQLRLKDLLQASKNAGD